MSNDHRQLIRDHDLIIEPLERAETIPSYWYTDPAFMEFERDVLFRRTWQFVGHVSQVKNPGDHVLGTVAGNPAIVVRGNDNVLRAFFNVCRHRGGPLALENGCSKVLQCKYHGWTYTLDGALRGTPKFDRTELFDKKDFGLVPLRLDTWEGLIFLSLSPSIPAVSSYLQGIVDRIRPMDLTALRYHRRVAYDVRCNWKVYMDNYLEGYHLPFVHPEFCSILDFQHYVTETFDHYSVQYSAFSQKESIYRKEDGAAWYFCVFPNFMMNILPGRLQTNLVLPVDHKNCRVIFDYLYDDPDSPDRKKMIEEDLRFSDMVQHEDIGICEHVQNGLASDAYTTGRFSPEMENAVHHYQSLLKKAYAEALQGRMNA